MIAPAVSSAIGFPASRTTWFSSARRTWSTCSPSRIWSPPLRRAWDTRTPFRYVPPSLPRSTSRHRSPSTTTWAWRAAIPLPGRTTLQEGECPSSRTPGASGTTRSLPPCWYASSSIGCVRGKPPSATTARRASSARAASRGLVGRRQPAPVEAPVLDRLGQVRGGDLVLARQVRDGARHAQDARVGARREPEPLARRLEEPPPRGADAAEAAHLAPGDVRVERDRARPEPAALAGARRFDPGAHGGRGLLGRGVVGERGDGHARHLDVEVDAVEERPRHAGAIAI